MKLNKILSSALAVVLLFAAICGAIPPISADAAYVSSGEQANLTSSEIKEIVNATLTYNFETAEEMLNYELEKGYLDYVSDYSGEYTIYVNRYTGVLYYRNNMTGQMLTSNPNKFTKESDITKKDLMSQIVIGYQEISSSLKNEYNSFSWAAAFGQISTEYIKGGIRVNYTLGDTTKRFLLPGRITAEKFESILLVPLIEEFEGKLEEFCSEARPDVNFSFFDNEQYEAYKDGCLNARAINAYLGDMYKVFISVYPSAGSHENSVLNTLYMDIKQFANKYILKNPSAYKEGSVTYNKMIKDYYTPKEGVSSDLEIFEDLTPIYVFDESAVTEDKRTYSIKFQKYVTDYTFTDMYADEAECGYVDNSAKQPVFRCALEYTFNIDGTLSVRLPANSITFDETVYILNTIKPLAFFGAGDMTGDGYVFYPDGSGTVVEFEDFYGKANIAEERLVYGTDYAYSKITGKHHEQVSMPVYGMVSEVKTNATTSALTDKTTVMNGYFAVIEEGEALAKIGLNSMNASHDYASLFCSYTPYPSDEYDLSDQISVGGSESYTMTAKTKYNGSYVTRIVMLTDSDIIPTIQAISGGKTTYYPSSYVGMATYYREFLKASGVLTALDTAAEKLPLYIEALGSMNILKKVLSFPVSAKLELTTFDDVYQMYQDFANAKDKLLEMALEYEALAEETEDAALASSYRTTATSYRNLSAEVEDITDVNFRLTGFGNGGMYATYPTKVRWDKACGGEDGFNALLKNSAEVSKNGGNLGIYPEYDFMYLNYVEAFDGFSNKGNISKMIDNRYASKQSYNSILGMYESFFTMVINPASLERMYSKFIGQYSKYSASGISVSTMGSDLNSNFDEDEVVNRSDAMEYVKSVLNKMAYQSGYDVMTNVGNAYSLKYVNHIIEASIDSSHLRYSSYAIPFVGMVLHGYVNYTGSAINYAGNAEYDILRSIESGASLYYILCYRNSAYLKDDEQLNKYYGVDYATWFDDIVSTYAELNGAIGDLQKYEIVDHRIIIGERIITPEEEAANIATLKAEMLEELAKEIQGAVDDAYISIREQGLPTGTPILLTVDKDAIMAQFASLLGLDSASDIKDEAFETAVDDCISAFQTEYAIEAGNTTAPYTVNVDEVVYTSKYSFITNSVATDKDNYVYTDFTSDVGNIVLVTYSNGVETVKFILNYNIYSVKVNLGDGYEIPPIEKYSYIRIEEGGNA